MSYTLNKTGAQIDVILNRAEAGGQLDLDIAAEAAARAAADALKAPLASPALTGTPTAPTAAPGTDTTQLATTAFANAAAAAAASAAASGKADKVAGATAGNLAGLDASGNLTDAGVAAEDVATKAEVQNITPKRTASNDPDNSSFAVVCDTAISGQAKPTLYGKSVAINQLQYNGNFASADGWNGGTVADGWIETTAGAASYAFAYNTNPIPAIIDTHKYYACGTIKAVSGLTSGSTTIVLRIGGTDSTTEAVYATNVILADGASRLLEGIFSPKPLSVGTNKRANWGVYNNANAIDAKWTNLNIIDLTAIFTAAELTAIGTSVANLKTAWLKKFGYPLPHYIPYNAGSIVSNNATYQMHGRNLWDEEWELGGYDATTGEPTTLNQVRSKATDPIKVSPSTSYCFYNASARISNVYWYDANDQYIGRTQNASANPFVTTSPDNAAFARFGCPSGYGTTYKSDICINLSDASFNGTYEAYYNGGTVTADNLNGIGTAVDEQDADGNEVRKIGTVDLGAQTWSWSAPYTAHYVAFSGVVPATAALPNALAAKYIPTSYYDFVNNPVPNSFCIRNDVPRIYVRTDGTQATLPAGQFVYEIATPTTDTTSAASIQTQAGYNSLDPVAGDVQSADADCEYPVDVIAYIDKKLAEL